MSGLAVALIRTRWFVRAPIWLYRARLGLLFGRRLLLLQHTGRSSGRRRSVVLEVVDRPAPGTLLVASALGERAQWFRNVRQTPQVRVQLGSRGPAPAVARVLAQDEAAAAIRRYASAHPRAWSRLRPVVEALLERPVTPDDPGVPVVALDLL